MKGIPRAFWLAIFVDLPFVFAAVLYPGLPEKVPMHFGADGRSDAWGGPGSIFLGPGIMGVVSVFMYALLTNIGGIDPKHRTSGEETAIKDLALFLTAFLSLLSLCMIAATAWPGLPVIKLMLGSLGIGFFGMGRYFPKLRPNYFAGFRLPWTLEDPDNWAWTQLWAGRVWIRGGLCIILAALLLDGTWLWAAFTILISVMVILPVLHSRRRYKSRA